MQALHHPKLSVKIGCFVGQSQFAGTVPYSPYFGSIPISKRCILSWGSCQTFIDCHCTFSVPSSLICSPCALAYPLFLLVFCSLPLVANSCLHKPHCKTSFPNRSSCAGMLVLIDASKHLKPCSCACVSRICHHLPNPTSCCHCCVPPFSTFANAMCLCFCVHSPFAFQCYHNFRGLWPHSFFESLHRASLPTVTSSRHVSSISAWSSASLLHLTFLAILFSRLFPFLPQSSVFPTISILHFLENTQ